MSQHLFRLLGISSTPVSHTEKLVSALGGFVAIFSIYYLSLKFADPMASGVLVASMGASAVLLFAVPHGQLSQPWPVIGGHMVSAFIGICCTKLLGHSVVSAALAVGVSIGVMYYLRCIHPPGGATALSAVIGGSSIDTLGFNYLLTPVLLNVVIILAVALIFNAFFYWRRYPAYISTKKSTMPPSTTDKRAGISHEDFVYALSEIDSFIDVNEHDLIKIYELATQKSQSSVLLPQDLQTGTFYSNGKYGDEWSVRQIVDRSPSSEKSEEVVIYKVVAGDGRRTSAYCTQKEFLRWARYRVIRDEENWKRLDAGES